MEIDFNTNRIPKAPASQPAARRDAAPPPADAASFAASEAPKNQLSNISTVRSEQVARAKELVADVKYPPDYLLDRIANLLADHIKTNSTSQPGRAS